MLTIFNQSSSQSVESSLAIGVLGDWYRGSEAVASEDWLGNLSCKFDHLVINVEACLSDASIEPRLKAGPGLKMPVRRTSEVRSRQEKVLATLANNHIYDYGEKGLSDTLSALQDEGVSFVGAGLDEREAWRPARLPCGSSEVVVINFSEGEDDTEARGSEAGVAGYEIARVVNLVHREKMAGNGVVVIFHGGRERVNLPPPYVQRLFRSLGEAGADCVIGHHPHVPQPWEKWQNSVLFYSIGNSLFEYGSPSGLQAMGLLPRIEFTGSGKLLKVSVEGFEARDGILHSLPDSSPLFTHLAEGQNYLKEASIVEEAWSFEAQRTRSLSPKALLRLFALLTLIPLRIRKGAKGFRAFVGTKAHQEFLTRRLTSILEGTSTKISKELEIYLNRKDFEQL